MLKPTIIYTDLQYHVQAAQSGNNIHDKYKPTMICSCRQYKVQTDNNTAYLQADNAMYKLTTLCTN